MPLIKPEELPFNMHTMAIAQEAIEHETGEPAFRVGDGVFPTVDLAHLGCNAIGYVEDIDYDHKNAGPFWFYYVKWPNGTLLWLSQSSLKRVAGV